MLARVGRLLPYNCQIANNSNHTTRPALPFSSINSTIFVEMNVQKLLNRTLVIRWFGTPVRLWFTLLSLLTSIILVLDLFNNSTNVTCRDCLFAQQ